MIELLEKSMTSSETHPSNALLEISEMMLKSKLLSLAQFKKASPERRTLFDVVMNCLIPLLSSPLDQISLS